MEINVLIIINVYLSIYYLHAILLGDRSSPLSLKHLYGAEADLLSLSSR